MSPEYIKYDYGTNDHSWTRWRWVFRGAISQQRYTRLSSAKRGFERFVRHISGKGRACS